MKIDFNKLPKWILIFSLFLIALSMAYHYMIFLPRKEKMKLENEKLKIEMEQEQKRIKLEQEKKEYIAKRKIECQKIYQQKKEKNDRVVGFRYLPLNDVCAIQIFPVLPQGQRTFQEILENCKKLVEFLYEKYKNELQTSSDINFENQVYITGSNKEEKLNELLEEYYRNCFNELSTEFF